METKETLGRAFRLADAVAYNAARVEVNQLMKTAKGGVALLALSKGQKLTEHTAPAAVTVLLLEGEVDFVVNDHVNHMTPGDALLMEAGTPHRVDSCADSKIMLVKVDN